MHYCYSGVSKRRSVEAGVGSWYIHLRDTDRIVDLAKLEVGIVVVVKRSGWLPVYVVWWPIRSWLLRWGVRRGCGTARGSTGTARHLCC
jgi:hypothetical protein